MAVILSACLVFALGCCSADSILAANLNLVSKDSFSLAGADLHVHVNDDVPVMELDNQHRRAFYVQQAGVAGTGTRPSGELGVDDLVGLLEDAGLNASAYEDNWVRFYIEDPRLSTQGLVAFAGLNKTGMDVPSISFKIGFALQMPRTQKLQLVNEFNAKHSWVQTSVLSGASSSIYMWMDQLLTRDSTTDSSLVRTAVTIYQILVQEFLTVILGMSNAGSHSTSSESTTESLVQPEIDSTTGTGH